jgi:hypothetical protein
MHRLNMPIGVLAAAGVAVMWQGPDAVVAADGFEAPFRIEAAGQPIDVEIGHAAPLVTDWDGDGVRDLLVGQFADGHLRIYRNVGTNARPRFEDFAKFETRAKLGAVPSG